MERGTCCQERNGASCTQIQRQYRRRRATDSRSHQNQGAGRGVKTKHTVVVEIFTDGACKGNPGIGGWGALLKFDGRTRELSGGEKLTTNNRMELLAVIRALEALTRPCEIHIHT